MAPATMAVKPKIATLTTAFSVLEATGHLRGRSRAVEAPAHSGSPDGYPAYQAHASSLSVRKGSAILRWG
jgi:hypothetical protein